MCNVIFIPYVVFSRLIASEGETQDPAQAAADASMLNKALHSRLVQIKSSSQLEVQQSDPNSPLFSVKSFEELRL